MSAAEVLPGPGSRLRRGGDPIEGLAVALLRLMQLAPDGIHTSNFGKSAREALRRLVKSGLARRRAEDGTEAWVVITTAGRERLAELQGRIA